MGGYLALPSAVMLIIIFFPHPQFCLFAQYSRAILSRASQISACKPHWYSLDKLRIGDTSRDNLLHSCWCLPLPRYFLSHASNIFAPQSGGWEVSVTSSCSWKHPSFEKVRFYQQLGSQYFAGSLPCHETCSSFHLKLPFWMFHKPLWILAVPLRPFSANLRNTGHPPELRQVHLRDQHFTDQQEGIKI